MRLRSPPQRPPLPIEICSSCILIRMVVPPSNPDEQSDPECWSSGLPMKPLGLEV